MGSASALVLLAALMQPPTSGSEVRAAVGDVLAIQVISAPEISGDYAVLSDGSVTGPAFGRVPVAGLTTQEIEKSLVRALSKRLKDPKINVFYRLQRTRFVYVVNVGGASSEQASVTSTATGSAVPYATDLTLRKILATVNLGSTPDQLRLTLTRGGKAILSESLTTILEKDSASGNRTLDPDDVVTIELAPYVRVWVTGSVKSPGEYRLSTALDAYQAVAQAGGIVELADEEYEIAVRRGPELIPLPRTPQPDQVQLPLQAGDTIVVSRRASIRIAVTGEVQDSGEYLLRSDFSVNSAIAKAGGTLPTGTLSNVVVLRKGQIFRVDSTGPFFGKPATDFPLQDGDVVIVRRNERVVIVLGSVKDAGTYPLEDGQEYRVSDMLARAGGLVERGTFRRVFLARPQPDGKVKVMELNLDEFLRDGKETANPMVQADDILLFNPSRNLAIQDVSTFLSPLILLDSLLRRR